MKVAYGDKELQTIEIVDTDRPALNILREKHAIGTYKFKIETQDRLLPSTAQPVHKHELLQAFGYKPERIKFMLTLEWKEIRDRIRDTTPLHSVATLMSSLYIAEQEALDASTSETFSTDKDDKATA